MSGGLWISVTFCWMVNSQQYTLWRPTYVPSVIPENPVLFEVDFQITFSGVAKIVSGVFVEY